MPVSALSNQPAVGSLHAAYRPVIIRALATATAGGPQPPFVACDIYVKDAFYKTMIRTAPDVKTDTLSEYVFDIADALQEYLGVDLPAINNTELLQAPHMSAKVFCRFRASDINPDGFTIEEGDVPVQGTKFTEAVPGGGLESNTFYVINAALQHEDNQDLAVHLNSYKQGTWAADAFPLTHRKRYFVNEGDSDHFPLVYSGECIQANLVLHYRLKGQANFRPPVSIGGSEACETPDFEIAVSVNRVDVNMLTSIGAGEKFFVQYKGQAEIEWTTVNFFTDSSFFFNVLIAGDYFLRIVKFCSACLSSDVQIKPFTIETSSTLAWRPKKQRCEQVEYEQPIYIELELRNLQTEDTWYPNNTTPYQHTVRTYGELWAKFFSDPDHLVPLNLVQDDVIVPVKQRAGTTQNQTPYVYYNEFETIQTYTVDVNGTQVMLSAFVETSNTTTEYDGNPSVPGFSTAVTNAFEAFPTDQLQGGNTGNVYWEGLEQYNVITGAPTGEIKLNTPGDPDYVPPVENLSACPIGVANTVIEYGFALQISKVEFRLGSSSPYEYVYATTVGDTGGGGYRYLENIPKDKQFAITVKAKSLASGANNDGMVEVRVTLDDNSVLWHRVPDNIETTLPQTFMGVKAINISNT